MIERWSNYTGKLTSAWRYGGTVEMLVDIDDYAGPQEGPVWIRLDQIAHGDASRYPLKGQVPDRGPGQWSLDEVYAFRVDRTFHYPEILAEHERAVEDGEGRSGVNTIDCSKAGQERPERATGGV